MPSLNSFYHNITETHLRARNVTDLPLNIYGNRARLIINGLINLIGIVYADESIIDIPIKEDHKQHSVKGEASEFLSFKTNGEVCINIPKIEKENAAKYLYDIVRKMHDVLNVWIQSYASNSNISISNVKNISLPADVDLSLNSIPYDNKKSCVIWKSYDTKEALFIIYRLYDRVIDFENENTELSVLVEVDDIRITLKENFPDEEFCELYKKFSRPDPIKEQYLISLINEINESKNIDKITEIGRKWLKELDK